MRSFHYLAYCLLALLCASAVRAQTLTVSQGSFSGPAAAGSTVHIWANPNLAGKVFDRWTGDTAALLDPFSAHTTLLRSTANVTLAASYKDAPAWTSTEGMINGTQGEYYFPPRRSGAFMSRCDALKQ